MKKKTQKPDVAANEDLKGKEYEKQLSKLHAELVKLQEWVGQGRKGLHRV